MPFRILAVETSCDETSAAVVEDGRRILSNIIYSQIKQHEVYGGVVPEIASRKHVEIVIQIIGLALSEAAARTGSGDTTGVSGQASRPEAAHTRTLRHIGQATCAEEPSIVGEPICTDGLIFTTNQVIVQSEVNEMGAIYGCGRQYLNSIDAVAVTYGPGLVGALLVGLSAAKGLAFSLKKPLIGVNHIEGHICAALLEFSDLEPPFTALVASGGHSHIYHVADYCVYELCGRTRDDAAGEVFDKIARAGGLGYPGGPKLSRAAAGGDPKAFRFPRVQFGDGTLDFSFSGPKTAALNQLNKLKNMYGGDVPDSAMAGFFASFEQAVADVLVENTIKSELRNRTGKIVLAGGVA
jgi:tRNA A37 threonylcarbamoyltransferase TsaD